MNKAELRERLKKPLLLELSMGCQDTAVVGGIEKLVTTVGKPFADILAVIEGYGQFSIEERKDRLEQVLALLEKAEQETRKQTDQVSTKSNEKQIKDSSQTDDLAKGEIKRIDVLDEELSQQRIDLGSQAAKKLLVIGIRSYRELLYYYPRRYEDRRALPHFGALSDQETVTVIGTITGRKAVKARTGMVVIRAFLEDQYGGKLTAVWFNQGWLEKQLFPGQQMILSGKVKRKGKLIEINVSHHEIDDEAESLSSDRIVGIYPTTQGLSQAYIRRSVHRLLQVLSVLPDHLPKSILEKYSLCSFDEAVREIHFPTDEKTLQRATRRLKFDEFFFLELRILLNRDTTLLGKQFKVRQNDIETFEKGLPFKMTGAQKRALKEIFEDMSQPRQMARLLQGDVGSGKTAVAAAAIYIAAKNGFQAALMAPTEILARQHYLNLTQYLFPLGVRCELLMGSMLTKERREGQKSCGLS